MSTNVFNPRPSLSTGSTVVESTNYPPDTVISGEPDCLYQTTTGLIFKKTIRSGQEVWEPGNPNFTFHRAYVVNPYASSPDQMFQWKNVFDTPTVKTTERVIDELKKLFPNAQFSYKEFDNYMIYPHSKQGYLITMVNENHSVNYNAGAYAKLWMFCGISAFRETAYSTYLMAAEVPQFRG